MVNTPDEGEMSKLSKIALGKIQQKLNTFTKPDGSTTLPGVDTAEYLTKHHFPSCKPIDKIVYNHDKLD